MKVVALLLCLIVAAQAVSVFNLPQGGALDAIKNILGDKLDDKVAVMQNVVKFVESQLSPVELAFMKNSFKARQLADNTIVGPEFRWIPDFAGAAKLSGVQALQAAPCFVNNTVTVTNFNNTGATLVFNVENPTSALCSDFYLIATLENIQFANFFTHGEHVVEWTFRADIKQSELNDLKRNGFRVFRFLDNPVSTIYELYETAMLFLPALTAATVPESCEEQNANFFARNVGFSLEKRNITTVPLDASLVQEGDMFGILRLDGLDPMLAWAMGSHTGHTVVAVKVDGVLNLCESTTNSSYWPTNGIQCTPYTTWVAQASKASQNVIHLPLRPDVAAKFNSSAAYAFFKQNEGLNYGYNNLLWAWQDNLDNYPYPLTPELHMLLPALVGKIYMPVADLLWNTAFNVRMGSTGLDAADLYEHAYTIHGWGFNDLAFMEESDSWMYPQVYNNGQTTQGRSMVCNVFVCAMWKAAGLFNDQPDFNCAETTNWDVETLKIFNADFARPQACIDADPTLPYCQILGNYRVKLDYYNSRWPIPSHAFANCPRGEPPTYDKPYPC